MGSRASMMRNMEANTLASPFIILKPELEFRHARYDDPLTVGSRASMMRNMEASTLVGCWRGRGESGSMASVYALASSVNSCRKHVLEKMRLYLKRLLAWQG